MEEGARGPGLLHCCCNTPCPLLPQPTKKNREPPPTPHLHRRHALCRGGRVPHLQQLPDRHRHHRAVGAELCRPDRRFERHVVQQHASGPVDDERPAVFIDREEEGAVWGEAEGPDLLEVLKGQRLAGGVSEVDLFWGSGGDRG